MFNCDDACLFSPRTYHCSNCICFIRVLLLVPQPKISFVHCKLGLNYAAEFEGDLRNVRTICLNGKFRRLGDGLSEFIFLKLKVH